MSEKTKNSNLLKKYESELIQAGYEKIQEEENIYDEIDYQYYVNKVKNSSITYRYDYDTQ